MASRLESAASCSGLLARESTWQASAESSWRKAGFTEAQEQVFKGCTRRRKEYKANRSPLEIGWMMQSGPRLGTATRSTYVFAFLFIPETRSVLIEDMHLIFGPSVSIFTSKAQKNYNAHRNDRLESVIQPRKDEVNFRALGKRRCVIS
ncbi:hypothetical protein BGW36DRAFT_355792 [Talaromyces proteolyticus]|uniref:Uncharacterized protein n=1 Tax=Talaromyces proteolyticus TaxID=1131652 RepID=A0AAD4L1R5_9EURO|nr:uncharacterized protein BGW36DRAFT_355792 [Talaromyces proteolyticus]KAH8701639.1 hypothetical protein BGW36DRAFT_355792 [Talaromyces proteolyticus]